MVHQRTQPAQILLVEDDAHDVQRTRKALDGGRFPVDLHVAADGDEALAFVQREGVHLNAPEPNFILLDIDLPKRSGLEVLQAIKSNPALRHIPVIMLTQSSRSEHKLEAYRYLANSYVVKPQDDQTHADFVRRIENFWLDLAVLPDGSTGSGLG